MGIRLVTPDDYARLEEINRVCYPEDQEDPTVIPRMQRVLRRNPYQCWVYEDETGVQACLLSEISESQPYIWSIATMPSHRGRGIAAALLQVFEKHYVAEGYKRLWLHVRAENPAQKVYFDAGFRVASFEANLYGARQHGLIMRKRID